jgi:uncharacterized RDD family membrane protein YckC
MDEAPRSPSLSDVQLRANQDHWRREVASRVRLHRARRRRRFDPNASFELDFPADAALAIAPAPPAAQPGVSLKGQDVQPSLQTWVPEPAELRSATRKVIRFPGVASLGPADLVAAIELVEPPQPEPRILDIPEPEQLELLPAFPDIRLDDEPASAPVRSIDLPPQPASPAQRIFSGMVDFLLLLAAEGVLFGVFTGLAGAMPSSRLTLPFAMISGVGFFCVFQFVFLVFGRRTPGMFAAGVELSTFSGQLAPVAARRARAFATTLSALSVGLGFLWALVDEDTFGWHDRISETYLRSADRVIR